VSVKDVEVRVLSSALSSVRTCLEKTQVLFVCDLNFRAMGVSPWERGSAWAVDFLGSLGVRVPANRFSSLRLHIVAEQYILIAAPSSAVHLATPPLTGWPPANPRDWRPDVWLSPTVGLHLSS
jgi:hypothetical protein